MRSLSHNITKCVNCEEEVIRIFLIIRRRFPATVNCWFCNENSRVPYDDINKFTCPKCEQYNGFTEVIS